MKKKGVLLVLCLCFVFFFLSTVFSAPQMSFNPPISRYNYNDTVIFNLTFDSIYLNRIIFNWNGTNTTLYDSSVVFMSNFDNVSSLDENNTFVRDISLYSKNGTFSGSPVWNASGKYNGAFEFDGDDYLTIPYNESFNFTDFSFSAWILLKANYSDHTLFSRSYMNYELTLDNTGSCNRFRFWKSNGTGTEYESIDGSCRAFNRNEWIHIVITFNSSSLELKSYINGTFYETKIAFSNDLYYNTANLVVGARSGGIVPFNGTMDEVIFFNRTLSSEEVSELYMSNLRKVNSSLWNLYINQTNSSTTLLPDGNYTYEVYSYDSDQSLNFSSGSITFYTFFTPIFPYNNLIFQRNSQNTSTLFLNGTLNGNLVGYSNTDNLTLSYQGTHNGSMHISSFSNSSFNTSFSLNRGVYNITLFNSEDPSEKFNFLNIGVGDLILVMGQSNAVPALGYPGVPYAPSKPVILITNTTRLVALLNTYRDAFMGYNISLAEDVPVMILNFAVGGTAISSWQNLSSEDYYSIAVNHINNYTGGTMNIKAVYWYQGESDIAVDNYTLYYNNLSNLVNNSFLDMNVLSGKFVVGQIMKSSDDNANPLNVRKAQQDAWYNLENVSRGPITYDIKLGVSKVHFDTNANKREFAERMMKSVLYSVYGVGENYPIVQNAYVINDTTLYINFSKSGLEISDWNGTSESTTAKGINITNETSFIDDNSVSNMALENNLLKVYFSEGNNLSTMQNLSMCNNFTCYGEAIVRNLGNNLPMEIVYNLSLTKTGQYVCEQQGKYWYSSSCHSLPEESSTTSPRGIRTFKPSESALKNGYSKTLKEKDKVEFSVNNEQKTVVVKKVDSENKEVVVSVSGNDYAIKENSSVKIDTDNDGYYDTEIFVNSFSGNSYANLEFKSIYEEIPKQEQEEKESPVGEIQFSKIKWYYYAIAGVIVLVITGYFVFREIRKRK